MCSSFQPLFFIRAVEMGIVGGLSPWRGQRSGGLLVLTILHTVIPNTCSATQKHIIPAHIRACAHAEIHTTSTHRCMSTFGVLVN